MFILQLRTKNLLHCEMKSLMQPGFTPIHGRVARLRGADFCNRGGEMPPAGAGMACFMPDMMISLW
ncbi:hypothetical protein CSC3H3_01815 [Thalassospira marina]|uniref:Uncharacterized protein n=2 Tax=Thalassospira marina TaxID=2048283 RepID=A0A2N3KJ30_9PROT|nr:hypothetical protein CSC3H3_01815 [Thalassospira marina]PKR50562.1 hypothetical protein COO20_20695 [Thalassospira marina]